MIDLLTIILLILSGYCISFILVNKDGPWDLIKKFRGVRYIEKVVQGTWGIEVLDHEIVYKFWWSKLFDCQICLGGWIAIGLSILTYFYPEPLILVPFAVWGGVILLVEILE